MTRVLSRCLTVMVCLIATVSACAESIYVPAESLEISGKNWVVKDHFNGWYVGRPDQGMLWGSSSGAAGQAGTQVQVQNAGEYRLWVRYLAVRDQRGPFEVSVLQDDQPVAARVFDQEKPDKVKEHAEFVWDSLTVTLEAGEARIVVRQVEPIKAAWLTRHLDAFVLSDELNQAPNIGDFIAPLYMQVRWGAEHPEPSVLHIFGRRPYRPWFVPHQHLGVQGLVAGVPGARPQYKLPPGQSSPWVNMAPLLALRGVNRLRFTAVRQHNQPLQQAQFELLFSTTPSEEGLLARFQRSGPGSAMILTIDQGQPVTIRSDVQWSSEAREQAQALANVPGRRPTRFPLATSVALNANDQPQVIANEAAVMHALGFNTVHLENALGRDPGITSLLVSRYIFHFTQNKSLAEPDTKAMHAALQQLLGEMQEHPRRDQVVHVNLMDEPYGPSIASLAASPAACRQFAEFLQAQGHSPSDLGAADWDQLKPSDDQSHPLLYVQSVRFRNQVMANFFATATSFIAAQRPDLRTTTNFANELSYNGNLLYRGADWFTILRSGALTYGWTEDWLNVTTTYQFTGMLCDMMRSATAPRRQPFGMHNILRRPWETQVKAAAEIGRGASALSYFNYGPYYAISNDQKSHRYDLYPALRQINYAIGAVEDTLIDSTVPPARLAQLYAHSTDIWTLKKNFSAEGKERMHQWLIARHLQEPIDILTEQDVLDGALSAYPALLLPETHVDRPAAQAIAAWVRRGGLLIVGPGSAQRDQLNQPLAMLQDLGIQCDEIGAIAPAGRDKYELPRQKPVAQVSVGDAMIPAIITTQNFTSAQAQDKAQVLARFSDGRPAVTRHHVDHGQVVTFGFFLGLSYGHMAANAYQTAGNDQPQQLNPDLPHAQQDHFPQAVRTLLAEALAPLGPPAVQTDHPLVQADLRRGRNSDLLVLSNWSGKPLASLKVTLIQPWAGAASFKAVQAAHVHVERGDQQVTLTLPLDAFDFIEMPR